MNYKNLNDFELLEYVNSNDENATNLLYEKYKPLIEKQARKLLVYSKYNNGYDLNDLIQEGLLGLSNAIKTYTDNKETSFFTYAKTCIERRQLSLVTGSFRMKNRMLNQALPLDSDEIDEKGITDYIGDNESNPENILTDIESSKELERRISNVLTDFERQVFELKINGFTYTEIADILDKDPKQIDNAIQRIKCKIKEII